MSESFWIFDSTNIRSAVWGVGNVWRKANIGDDPEYPENDAYVSFGGPATRLGDLRAVITADRIPDIAWTIPDCLVQERILDLFREECFTGFEARTAAVSWQPRRKRNIAQEDLTLPQYYELLVTGWGGIAAKDSGVEFVPETDTWEGYPDWTRMIDEQQWDGSDFFIVWPFAFTRIVTERVAKFIRTVKPTGAKLISLEEYTESYIKMNLCQTTPMRLRDHFPERKAREIGEPLGIY